MSLRRQWRFGYQAGRLVRPADEKREHHRDRARWWQDELEKAEKDLRQHGVEFREYPVTGGTQVNPVLDPTRQARVQECRQKVKDHESLAEEYALYARAFELNPDVELELDAEDVKFFGL
jgi:hypothetical protein